MRREEGIHKGVTGLNYRGHLLTHMERIVYSCIIREKDKHFIFTLEHNTLVCKTVLGLLEVKTLSSKKDEEILIKFYSGQRNLLYAGN